MAEELKRGIFITLEGSEGSGKSTQADILKEDLISDGYDVVLTQEPGGTGLGNKIREVLLKKDEIKLCFSAELLLFEADRAQHVEEMIVPALSAGKVVICDRFNTATFAYQGYGLGMDMDLIKTVDDHATGGLCPDITILLKVDVETGLVRAGKTGGADRMEKRSVDFHEKVWKGYLDLAKRSSDRIKVVEVQDNIEDTYRLIREEVYSVIEKYQRAG